MMSPGPHEITKNTRKWLYLVYISAAMFCISLGAYLSWEFLPRTDEFKAKYENAIRDRDQEISQLHHVQAATTATIAKYRADSTRNADLLQAYRAEVNHLDRYTDSLRKRDAQIPTDSLFVELLDMLDNYQLRPRFNYHVPTD